MWLDSTRCSETFHVIGKDDQDKWIVVHSDDQKCLVVEFGGEMEQRVQPLLVEKEF